MSLGARGILQHGASSCRRLEERGSIKEPTRRNEAITGLGGSDDGLPSGGHRPR